MLSGYPDTMPSPFGLTLVSREAVTSGSPCKMETWSKPLYLTPGSALKTGRPSSHPAGSSLRTSMLSGAHCAI